MSKRRSRGEGSIFFSEKENSWIAEIVLPDGRRRRKRSKRQQVVKNWLLSQREAIKDGIVLENERITVDQFFDRYIKDVAEHTLRPKTLETYKALIRLHIRPEIGNIRLSALTPVHIQKLYADKLNSGLSRRTVQFIHSIIHRGLEYALRWNLVVRNVSDLVDKPSPKKKLVEPLTAEQVNKLLDTVRNHPYYPIYVCAVYLGLREGEVLGIHAEDLDIERGILHPEHAVQYIIGQGLSITEPKSEASKQPINIPSYALSVLKKHVEQLKRNQGLIFTTRNGTPIMPRNLVRHFKSILVQAGLPNVRFHDLRHTTASLLIEAGSHPKEIQYAMRHSQWSLTMDTYGHLMPGMSSSAANRLDELLGRQ